MKTLLEPQNLGLQPVGMGIGADRAEPLPRCREYLVSWSRLEVGAGAVPCPPFVGLELVQNLEGRLAELRLRGDQRLLRIAESVDASLDVVAVWVPLAVLHVADQRVGPVAKPEGPVGADLGIDRPEVLIGALEEVEGSLGISGVVPHPLALVAGAVVGHCPPGDAVHVDHAGVDELVLHVVRKLPAAEIVATYHGPHILRVEHRIEPLAAAVLGSRKGCVPVLRGTGTVTADTLPPLIEHVAPRVAVARGLEMTNSPGSWIEHVGPRRAVVAERAPWRLDGRAHRHALEHVEQAAGAGLEGTGGVVGVFRGKAVEHVHDRIGFVIAVGVSQPEHPRLVHHQHAAVEKLKTGRAVQLVVKYGALVGRAVLVGIFEDHEFVGRRRVARLPLRIARHRRDPEAAL